MTYNKVSGETKFYINGNLIPSQTTIGNANIAITEANNKDFIIGCQKGFGWAPNGWFPFNGIIDDIRIYNRELFQSEINALYNE